MKRKRIKKRYRIIIEDAYTLRVLKQWRFSPHLIFLAFILIIVLWTALLWSLITYTPVRYWVLGYDEVELREKLVSLNQEVDSLIYATQACYVYVEKLRQVLTGHVDTIDINTITAKGEKIIADVMGDLPSGLGNEVVPSFIPPVDGFITNTFNVESRHFGIDIATREGNTIVAVEDGIVIFSDWTLNTGYVIAIAHKNGWISVYKHNKVVLKEQGDIVKAGEPIALAGATGLLTKGTHLHFELWFDGSPVDPMQVILF